MKITKLVHSCLLVDTGSSVILIDPGKYAYDSRQLSSLNAPKLDYIIFTHEHSDHYYSDSAQILSKKYPHARIISNTDLSDKIKQLNLSNPVSLDSQADISVFEAVHEPLAFNQPVPKNIGVHIAGTLTHPGDAHHMDKVCPVLALPVTAPWTSLKQSLENVVEIKPKTVIPIHDWHWHKQARLEQYAMAKKLLEPYGIEFASLDNSATIEV